MASNKQTRQIILRLLNNLGDPKEVRQYLKRYSDLDAHRFAVVKVGGATLQTQLNALSSSLTFLQQVGLTPIVIHGAGPQLNQALANQHIPHSKRDGIRVTTPEILQLAKQVFTTENQRLTKALQDAGTQATSIVGGVFEAKLLNQQLYGMVGRVETVHLDTIDQALDAHSIPVISPLAESGQGQILNINADVAANELVRAVEPSKIIFLTDTGGILDGNGDIISSINLKTDYRALMGKEWLHSGMRLKLEQIHNLLSALPSSSSVSVTHPSKLAKELFTHSGSGTFVRWGEEISTYSQWNEMDLKALKKLLETSFKKKLHPVYFGNTVLHKAFVSDSYRAAALIVQDGEYLRMDKFAVTEEAQGEGLGKAVWQEVTKNYQHLYWRARPDNPVNPFYFQQADGAIKHDEWQVFWYGFDSIDSIPGLVKKATDLEATML